jgi:hypothetical protein
VLKNIQQQCPVLQEAGSCRGVCVSWLVVVVFVSLTMHLQEEYQQRSKMLAMDHSEKMIQQLSNMNQVSS